MQPLVIGVNHRTAGVAMREQVAFSRFEIPDALQGLVANPNTSGSVILSTCNRTEFYLSVDDAQIGELQVVNFLASARNLDTSELKACLYSHAGDDAVRHLFDVVSSLDSMVLGEQEIIRQVRDAFSLALDTGTVDMLISRLFRQAFSVGKRVRTQTALGESHVSVATVAVDVAQKLCPGFAEAKVLVNGAGEMGTLLSRYLLEAGVGSLQIMSRTLERANAVASELGIAARPFEEIADAIEEADIVFTASSAPHFVITPERIRTRPAENPLLIIDIALPRDADPRCLMIPRVTVYDLNDLNDIINANEEHRRLAAEEARAIVERELASFNEWEKSHSTEATIKDIHLRAEGIREHEVDHLLKIIGYTLDDDEIESVNAATRAIVKKMLDPVCQYLRARAKEDQATSMRAVHQARHLFRLGSDEAGQTEENAAFGAYSEDYTRHSESRMNEKKQSGDAI